jgi:hypothetical protein
MSLNDAFGDFPGRPDHPDFAMLSDVVLRQDGKIEDSSFDVETYIESMIDPPALRHMATQRARRMIGLLGLNPDNSARLVAAIAGTYVDAFMTGYHFHIKRLETDTDT